MISNEAELREFVRDCLKEQTPEPYIEKVVAELRAEAAFIYIDKLRDLLVKAYELAGYVWGNVPPKYITVEFCDQMNKLCNEMSELGIEV